MYTGSDGVYTGYLSSTAPVIGHFNIRIIVTDNDGASVAPRRRGIHEMAPATQNMCCGSKIPLHGIVPSGHFIRYAPAVSLYIGLSSSDKDVMPPSRIVDLSVGSNTNKGNIVPEFYSNNSMEVTLSWSAPGDNYHRGSAHRLIDFLGISNVLPKTSYMIFDIYS